MGHKVNPKAFRIGLSEDWNSRWFKRGDDFVKALEQDNRIRRFLKKKLKDGGVENVEIERSPESINITISSSKPGIIIGRGGAGIEEIKKHIDKKIIALKGGWKDKLKININIKEVATPQLSAQIVATNIALELEKRIPYRRAMKRNMDGVMKAGAQGVKIICSGRLNGAEIARSEKLISGKIPLHTLRADIDYGFTEANTTYGVIGVKVWIYKGEVFGNKKNGNK